MSKGGLGDMMKQFQQMQAKMEEIQAELELTEVEGTSGGGMVEVTLNGKNLGILWKPPFRVDITKTLKPGKNVQSPIRETGYL